MNLSRDGLRLKSDNTRRCCRLQDGGAVQGRSESRWRGIAHLRGRIEVRLARGGIREHAVFLGHEMTGPAGTGRKIKQRSDVGCRLRKGRVNNAVRALKICQKRRMCTSTVLSAIEWRQMSRQPTTSYGDICMPAYKLHKHQRVSSDLSQLIKSIV